LKHKPGEAAVAAEEDPLVVLRVVRRAVQVPAAADLAGAVRRVALHRAQVEALALVDPAQAALVPVAGVLVRVDPAQAVPVQAVGVLVQARIMDADLVQADRARAALVPVAGVLVRVDRARAVLAQAAAVLVQVQIMAADLVQVAPARAALVPVAGVLVRVDRARAVLVRVDRARAVLVQAVGALVQVQIMGVDRAAAVHQEAPLQAVLHQAPAAVPVRDPIMVAVLDLALAIQALAAADRAQVRTMVEDLIRAV
jgi:hypothetical protein